MSKNKQYTITVPNGGYGWAIVAGSFLTNIFNQSLVSLFGLLFGDKINSITPSTGAAALIMNVASLFLNFSGLLTGPLLKFYTPRALTIFGSFLSGLGLMLCSLSTEIWHLLLSYSLCVGFGLGVIIQAQFNAINRYFSTRKGCSVGIAVAGTGTGQALLPHLVRYLLEIYGFSGSVLIMGGLAWNGLVGGSLFQPVEWHLTNKEKKSKKKRKKSHEMTFGHVNDTNNVSKVKTELQVRYIKGIRGIGKQIFELMDLKLLRDPSFLILTLGLALAYTASISFSMIYPFYLQVSYFRLKRTLKHLKRGFLFHFRMLQI